MYEHVCINEYLFMILRYVSVTIAAGTLCSIEYSFGYAQVKIFHNLKGILIVELFFAPELLREFEFRVDYKVRE